MGALTTAQNPRQNPAECLLGSHHTTRKPQTKITVPARKTQVLTKCHPKVVPLL